MALLVLLGLSWALPDGLACRYTVRDSGFVNTGRDPWRLMLYTRSPEEKEILAAVQLEDGPALAGVEVRVKNLDRDGKGPAFELPALASIERFPAAVLVAPDGRPLVLPWPEGEAPLMDRTRTLLRSVVSSPVRDRVLDGLVDPFCVILLAEGEDAAANRTVREEAGKAIARIAPLLPLMDKPLEKAPIIVPLTRKDRDGEAVLRHALGLDGGSKTDGEPTHDDAKAPRVAVIFGRGRRIGPLLAGGEITETALFNILRVVGTDCECDLHPAWFNGPAVPLAWDAERLAYATEILGFDPENPMVKIEVSRILGRGRGDEAAGDAVKDPFAEDLLLGYTEEVIAFDESAPGTVVRDGPHAAPGEAIPSGPGGAPHSDAGEVLPLESGEALSSRPGDEGTGLRGDEGTGGAETDAIEGREGSEPGLQGILIVAGGIAALGLLAGLAVLLRRRGGSA